MYIKIIVASGTQWALPIGQCPKPSSLSTDFHFKVQNLTFYKLYLVPIDVPDKHIEGLVGKLFLFDDFDEPREVSLSPKVNLAISSYDHETVLLSYDIFPYIIERRQYQLISKLISISLFLHIYI